MRKLIGIVAAAGFLVATHATRADDLADVQALVAKAIKAHGGEANLAKCKAATSKMKGTVNVAGMSIEFTATNSIQMPAQLKIDTEMEFMGKKFTVLQVFNGDKGWLKVNDKVMDLEKDAIDEAKEQIYTGWVTNTLQPLKDKAIKLSSTGEIKVDGKAAVGVLVTAKDRRDVTLYFDKKTGLLAKSEWRAKDVQNGGQEFTAETFYSNYKEFDGIQRPTKLKMMRDGKDFAEIELTEFQCHDKLDNSVFAKP